MVKIAVMGHGVVGSGVAELLQKNAAHIAAKAGEEIVLERVLDLREFSDLPYADKFTKRFADISDDPTIQIVVETMGGLTPAYDYVKACLLAGKSVVTSNKELVAQKGDELLALAKEKGLNFLFEASVGGGIPVLRPLDQCLAANEVSEVTGILNGTTNFMLTRMIEDGMPFEEALLLAQKRGYAERDPSADIDGLDACRKICILASLAFGRHVYPAQVRTEGIREITLTDVRLAAAVGGVIKLIGKAVKNGEHVSCAVAPMIVRKEHLLSDVRDVFNAILVRGDAIGDVVFYGRGAGKLPTASAVLADVIDEVKHLKARKYLYWSAGAPDYAIDFGLLPARMLLRVRADADKKADLAAAFGNIEFVTCDALPQDELAFVTSAMTEKELDAALKAVSGAEPVRRLRLAEL